jgi:hypothetical protein
MSDFFPTPLWQTNDYRVLPIGTKIDRGEIQVCPRCGKTGLRTENENMIIYTHVEGTAISTDGSPEMFDQVCYQNKSKIA